jgi:GTP cyclohydrolase I
VTPLAVQAVQDILRAIGEDVNQEGLFALVNRLADGLGVALEDHWR